MNCRKGTWLLALILIGIHLALQISLFVSAQFSRDPEAHEVFGIVSVCISFPSSLAVGMLDQIVSNEKILWESDVLYVRKYDHYVDRFFGFTEQTFGDFIIFVLLVLAGTVQWGIVGVLIQSVWRRLTRRRKTLPAK
jgi:hypothetical protein